MYLVGSGSFVRCSIGSSSPPAADPNPSLASESLNLSSAIAGGTGFMFTVNGTNSVSPSTMQFSGNPLAASFVSGSPLQASIPAADIAAAISANIGDRKLAINSVQSPSRTGRKRFFSRDHRGLPGCGCRPSAERRPMRRLRSVAQGIFFVACLLSIVPELPAQIPDTWQEIPKDDLALKDNPANPGSSAMILERQVYTDDEKRIQTEWLRIKILTEEGRAYADVEIPYLAKSITIEGIRGRTVRPNGNVITFDGTTFDKVVAKYRRFLYEAKAFALPGVEVGSVIEYAYTMRWKERLPDYVRNPASYTFKEGWTIPTATWTVQEELFTRHAVFVIRPVKGGHLSFAKVRLSDNSPSWYPDGTMRMEVNNVAPIEDQEYMPPLSLLNSRVHFFYVAGYVSDYWRSIGRLQAEKAEKFIEKTKFLERAANEIAPPGDPPETRLRKLYSRVQQVRYLSYEPTKTEKEAKREHLEENKSAEDIFRRGYGYGNEINFLFTALARAGGFDASIVEVVDRRSAIFESEVLDASQLNAMIVLVRLKGESLYFDPASRFCPYGVVPWFETDTTGVTWEKLGGQILEVHTPATESSTIERNAELKLQPDGSLEGTLEVVFRGQEALDRRLSAANEDEAGRRKLLEEEIKDLTPRRATIDVDSVTGWQDSELPLRVKCHFHAWRFAVLTPKRMLFPLAVFQVSRKSFLSPLKRVQPVYFRYGSSEVDKITISLPTDYSLEAVPSETNYQTPFAVFQAKRTGEAGIVRLERHAIMSEYYFPKDFHASLWNYFEKLRQSDAENVVLHQLEGTQARH